MNYTEVDLIHKNVFTSLNALKNGLPTSAAEQLLKRDTVSSTLLARAAAPQAPPTRGCASHTVLFRVPAWVLGTSQGEGGWPRRYNVCQHPCPWRLNTDRSCCFIPSFPANREICSEKPSPKSKPSAQESEQGRLGRQPVRGRASARYSTC